MSEVVIPAGERGKVYVLSLPRMMTPVELAEAIGATRIVPTQVDIVDVEDLGELGLAGYLAAGMGVEQVDALALQGVSGAVALIRSAAFGGVAQVLRLVGGITQIDVYDETQGTPAKGDLSSDAALPPESDPEPAPRRVSDAAMSGRIAMIALAVLLGVAAMMVWIA